METTAGRNAKIIYTMRQMYTDLGFPRRKVMRDAKSDDFSVFGFEEGGRIYFNLPKYESYLERCQDDLIEARNRRRGR